MEQLENEMAPMRAKRGVEVSDMMKTVVAGANEVWMRSFKVISIMTLVLLPMSFMATFFSIEILRLLQRFERNLSTLYLLLSYEATTRSIPMKAKRFIVSSSHPLSSSIQFTLLSGTGNFQFGSHPL